MSLNATFGNVIELGSRAVGLRVLNFHHVRIGTHIDGIRDPDHPCAGFVHGTPDYRGTCLSDGHYICKECIRFDLENGGHV